MAKSRLLEKENISKLFSTTIIFPEYRTKNNVYPAQSVIISERLDQVSPMASYIPLMAGCSHLHPYYQTEKGQMEANKFLSNEFYALWERLENINAGTSERLPSITDTQRIFADAWQIFNPDDSYGKATQDLLQQAADILQLGRLGEITKGRTRPGWTL